MKVQMFCLNHPDLRWETKQEAVTPNGHFSGSRNIFFVSPPTCSECSCSGSLLRAVPGQTWEGKAEACQ